MVKQKKAKAVISYKLDLGCGNNKREGFTGIDFKKTPAVDIVHDLFKFPWPFADGSVEEVHCSHFFEHVPAKLRGAFMDELYRVMKPGAKAQFITPYWSSVRAIQDPTHEWPPISEMSYLYFNKGWREANKLEHYGFECDFDFTCGYGLAGDIAPKNQEAQQFAISHYINAANDLFCNLTRR